MQERRLAPIVLFVYRRPDHTRLVLEALKRNPEAAECELIIYSDGSRGGADTAAVDQVRALCRTTTGFRRTHLVERPRNLGLAESVLAGVTETCLSHGRVIVLEDDLIVSPHFLGYMNEALTRYADDPSVLQVSGHLFPVEWTAPTDAAFLPMSTSWGWATWQRAWSEFNPGEAVWSKVELDPALLHRFDLGGAFPYSRMLEAQARGEVDSWAIRWWFHVCQREGLVLFPARTLVRNLGFDGTGVHCAQGNSMDGDASDFRPVCFPEVQVDMEIYEKIVNYFHARNKISNKIARKIKKFIFKNPKYKNIMEILLSDPWGKINALPKADN